MKRSLKNQKKIVGELNLKVKNGKINNSLYFLIYYMLSITPRHSTIKKIITYILIVFLAIIGYLFLVDLLPKAMELNKLEMILIGIGLGIIVIYAIVEFVLILVCLNRTKRTKPRNKPNFVEDNTNPAVSYCIKCKSEFSKRYAFCPKCGSCRIVTLK